MLMVAAALVAVVGIGYLIDKFIGFDVVLKAVGEAIGWVWDGIKSLIKMLPDALIPDGWKRLLPRRVMTLINSISSLEN
ncbi:hypothetical protein PCNPT3_07560 [Psychromonas sp. CNPT3]|uniref:hypothetical protein n=1 Tax=Psychromonas sp. CNPT3 TaxID=314282 RepID=UPI00006E70E0|nr:hypothetical protein [Psychromonas sp. CNPT3]AGH81450.1 hypothetical protein PCNPT3_07560 [Psychromonas sp. CNPT3]